MLRISRIHLQTKMFVYLDKMLHCRHHVKTMHAMKPRVCCLLHQRNMELGQSLSFPSVVSLRKTVLCHILQTMELTVDDDTTRIPTQMSPKPVLDIC